MQARALPLRRQRGRGDPGFRIGRRGTATSGPWGASAAAGSRRRSGSRPKARDLIMRGGRSPNALLLSDLRSHDVDAQAAGQRDRCRTQAATTWMLRPPVNATAVGQSGQRGSRAARPFWSESGGRGGVSDLGGGEQARRRRGRPRPGRGMSPFALVGPAMPDGTKAIEGYPRPHARACVWRRSARLGDVPRSG